MPHKEGDQLTLAGTVNNARVAQREVNQALLSELIGIGQGVNASALAGLGMLPRMKLHEEGHIEMLSLNTEAP